MTKSKLGRILAIATTACAILLGILFIICCAHLYFTGGDNPYSRERVGEYLKVVAIPSVITIALTVWGIIYNAVKGESVDEKTARTSSDLLESFVGRYDFDSFHADAKTLAQSERNKRKTANIVAISASALLFVLVFAYVVFVANFTIENLNADVIAALTVALPLSAVAVAIHIPRIYLVEESCKKELDILKASIKEHGAPNKAKTDEKAKSGVDYAVISRYIIVGAAVALIILGATNGGMADVLEKAVKICTECIGLG